MSWHSHWCLNVGICKIICLLCFCWWSVLVKGARFWNELCTQCCNLQGRVDFWKLVFRQQLEPAKWWNPSRWRWWRRFRKIWERWRSPPSYYQCVRKGPQLRTWSSWGPNCWNGPHLVLILHKRPHLPQIWYIMGFESVFLYHKWRNIEISNSILLYMHLLGNGMYNKSYHNEHMSFCHKMCNVVNTPFFMTISHFNENNDLGSSKAL